MMKNELVILSRHYHPCPRCHVYEVCDMDCDIVEDIGFYDNKPCGNHTLCTNCIQQDEDMVLSEIEALLEGASREQLCIIIRALLRSLSLSASFCESIIRKGLDTSESEVGNADD